MYLEMYVPMLQWISGVESIRRRISLELSIARGDACGYQRRIITVLMTLVDTFTNRGLLSISAASGILFPGQEEAAFSNFRLLESTGSVLFYLVSPSLCTRTKMYVLIVAMLVGMTGFSTIEFLEKRAKKGRIDDRKFELVASDMTKL